MNRIFNTDDFDNLSWHDNFIHAISFDPDSFKLYLDIDYLSEWLLPSNKQGQYSFVIAASTLVFSDVYDLNIDIKINNMMTFDIYEIVREPYNSKCSTDPVFYRYQINLDSIGKISFTSSGFAMYLRKIFDATESQCLSKKERGGVSFDIELQ